MLTRSKVQAKIPSHSGDCVLGEGQFTPQNAKEVYYKLRQLFYYKMRQLLQIATTLFQDAIVITKYDVY